jgi:hypothetical protein
MSSRISSAVYQYLRRPSARCPRDNDGGRDNVYIGAGFLAVILLIVLLIILF